jgi:flagellar M-ring protein FliF
MFLLMVVRPMMRKLIRPEVDPTAIAAAAADAAAREAAAAERIKTERIAQAVAEAAAKMASEKAAAEKAAEQAAVALAAQEKAAAGGSSSGVEGEEEIEIQEGETLEEIKARMSSLKPKKPTISADMLDTANTYDDKVALIRMIVSEEAARARVAGVLKNMIQLS